MKRTHIIILLFPVLLGLAVFAGKREKLQALHEQYKRNEPKELVAALKQVQPEEETAGAASSWDGISPPPASVPFDYRLIDPPVAIGGLDSSGVVFLESHGRVALDSVSADELRSNGRLRLGLTGKGARMGMWEIADPLTNHTEFLLSSSLSRVIEQDGPSPNQQISSQHHATYVAGIMAAQGKNPAAAGFAPEGVLHAYDVEAQYTEMTGIFANDDESDDLFVANYSFGRRAGWSGGYLGYPLWWGDRSISTNEDYRFGYYDDQARQIDEIAWLQETFLMVRSAGNNRLSAPLRTVTLNSTSVYYNAVYDTNRVFQGYFPVYGPYPEANGGADGYDTITSFALAKNALTVAAGSDVPGGYGAGSLVFPANFSSTGPTDDGRIKPDLMANGVSVFSTFGSTRAGSGGAEYDSGNGTSAAAPGAAGTLGQLEPYYRELYGADTPPLLASTWKALLLHTADDVGLPGPDYRTGWGLLNAMKAASFLRANHEAEGSPMLHEGGIATNGVWRFDVRAVGSGTPLKITLVWSDPPAAVHSPALNDTARKLVNDLNLTVINENGGVTLPWILDPVHPGNAAARGVDNRNNVEQTLTVQPIAGTHYTIRVESAAGTMLVDDEGHAAVQKFSLLISGAQLTHNKRKITAEIIPAPSGAELEVLWTPLPGKRYSIEVSSDLLSGWTPLAAGESHNVTPVPVLLPAASVFGGSVSSTEIPDSSAALHPDARFDSPPVPKTPDTDSETTSSASPSEKLYIRFRSFAEE